MRSFDYLKIRDKKWDLEVLTLIAKIHEYKGKQELYIKQKPMSLEKLVEIAKVQSTEASNQIEGIVTTDTRIKQLVNEKTSPRNRDEEEIAGYRDVLNMIHESHEYIPIQSNYILQLHKVLYSYSGESFGGKFKNTQNYIAEIRADGTRAVRFQPLAPYETSQAIDVICESYNQAIAADIEPLLLIPSFITDFLCIHPFNDGNGRMSRLMTALLLYKSGFEVGKYISIETKIAKTKLNYYEALQDIDEGWHEGSNDVTPFIKYLLGVILASYRDFENRLELVEEKKPALEMVRNAVKEQIGKFTKAQIVEYLPALRRAAVEKALKILVDEGEITRHGGGRSTFYTRND